MKNLAVLQTQRCVINQGRLGEQLTQQWTVDWRPLKAAGGLGAGTHPQPAEGPSQAEAEAGTTV